MIFMPQNAAGGNSALGNPRKAKRKLTGKVRLPVQAVRLKGKPGQRREVYNELIV